MERIVAVLITTSHQPVPWCYLIQSYLSTTAISVIFKPSHQRPNSTLLPDMVGPSFREFARRARSESPGEHASMASSAPSRISLRIPSLNLLRQDTLGQAPSNDKPPLLSLKVSSRTLIDSAVVDDASNTPLYTIKTVAATTTVTRKGTTGNDMQFASIKWPKVTPTKVKGREVSDGVEIRMGNSRYIGGETLLQFGAKAGSARKFSIPNYSQGLKWKRKGDSYWCTTPSLKGPVAVLELAKDRNPIKLTIYETLRDKYDIRGVLYHQGVYILLLDYLIVTAILLLTGVQEWRLVKKHEEKSISVPNPLGGDDSSVEASTSQWRKIVYGEPIYPKRSGESSSNISTSDSASFPQTPISSRRRSDTYGFRSSLQTNLDESLLSLSSDSDYDDNNMMEDAVVYTRPGSPAESTHPTARSHAPAHSYIDPSFYPKGAPPVPPLPLAYVQSNQSLRDASPASPSSPRSKALRILPRPPSQQLLSNSPLSASMSIPEQIPENATSTPNSPPTVIIGRTRSMTMGPGRRLPRPLPSVPHASNMQMNTLRRARSHAELAGLEDDVMVPPLPPLPPPPLPPSLNLNRNSQRSLPQTPVTSAQLDPSSPDPESLQEELRVTAATVHMIRQQQQQHHHHHHQSPSLRTPPWKSDHGIAGGSGDGSDEGHGEWLTFLPSPSGGTMPSLSATTWLDLPPPAYSETYDDSHAKPRP